MIRLLQILLLIALAYVAWRLVRNALAARAGTADREPQRFAPTARCARCGTYVPREQLDASGACPKCLPRA
jgi:predicted Zn-ribbon and HTH transcriptional regulator